MKLNSRTASRFVLGLVVLVCMLYLLTHCGHVEADVWGGWKVDFLEQTGGCDE